MRRKDRDIIDEALWAAFERGREGSGLGAGHPSDLVKALDKAGFEIMRKAPAGRPHIVERTTISGVATIRTVELVPGRRATEAETASKFDAFVVRDAYRLGYERATYESGGDPAAMDLEGSAYRWGRAHDLIVHLGDGDVHECFEAFIGSRSSEPAAGGETYEITPEGAAIIRDLIEQVPLTQEAVTAMGEAIEQDCDATPDRYLRNISGRDHAVDPTALAVRDVIEAHRILGQAVATLGHEAVDAMMRSLPAPILGAAA